MRKSVLIVLPGVLVSLVLAAGLVRERGAAAALRADLLAREAAVRELEAERNGLREANADLMGHLESMRRVAAQLPAVEMEAVPMNFAVLPPAVMEEEMAPEPERGEGEPERELTAEEIAAREQREAERAARRAEWEARRAEMRERTIASAQERKAFFEQVSAEGLTPEYQEAQRRLVEAMDEVQIRMAAISNPDLSRDERREMGRELRELSQELGGLMGMQREILLNDYAQAMGYQGQDARVFIDSIETINRMTDVRELMRGGGGGRGPR